KDERVMADILGKIAGFIMVEPPRDSRRWCEAVTSIEEFTAHLVERVDQAVTATGHRPQANLLGRLATLRYNHNPVWLDSDWIRRYMTGLAAFGSATIVRAATHTIDRLLQYPCALRRAQELAALLEHDTVELNRLNGSDPPSPTLREILE